jgi:hypothetical protein
LGDGVGDAVEDLEMLGDADGARRTGRTEFVTIIVKMGRLSKY